MALSKVAAERLASELLLGKGGGVYYEKARVAPDENTATLFIGLGGTGADMLIRIKNEVKRRMERPQINGKVVGDIPQNIGFIAFDTAESTKSKTWGSATFDKFGSEFCSLAVDNVPAVVENRCKLVDQGDPVWQWYEKIPANIAVDGANGRRQIGRLLLFENARNVYDKCKSRLNEIRSFGTGIKTVNVFLVTGIAGGTGSGTFIDMAYLVRKAFDDLSIENGQVFGFIVLPDVNLLKGGQPDRLSANAFASLKELDYWMEVDDHKAVFEQDYGRGISVRSERRIFEFCHMLSATDFAGTPLNYDKVISSMAEFVFAYVAGEVGANASGNSAIKDMYNNISNYVDTISGKVSIPACYRYLAVGTHKLEIPYEEISTLLAIRLFDQLEPIFALRPTEETFKADMKTLRLIPKTVIHNSLTENMPASPIDGNPNYQYTQIWGAGNDSYNRNAPYIDAMQWYARDYQTTVTKNVGNYVNVQNGYFMDFVRDNMKKPDRGPMYLSSLLKSDTKWSIIPTLDEVAQHCSDVSATCETQRGALEDALRREYNAGHGKIINKKKSVDSYIAALREWMENEAGIYVYAERSRVVRELRDRFALYYDKVFSKLADVIEALPAIFQQNLDFIAIEEKEAFDIGKIDDTKLIWPMKFMEENRAEFDKLVNGACAGFLENLSLNLAVWTGSDLETLDEKAGGNTDVPGFISNFISEQFGSLLNINMEDVMRAQQGGADNLEEYFHDRLLYLKKRAVPMFSIDSANRNLEMDEFAIASVPEDCLHIQSEAKKRYESNVTIKVSKEKTRLYYVKVISGIPLYVYAKINECAKFYQSIMSIDTTRRGTHLDPLWADAMPSPYPEGAWASDYKDGGLSNFNKQIKDGFDACLAAGVIYIVADTATKECRMKLANPEKANLLDSGLFGSVRDRLSQMNEIEEELWSGGEVVIPKMGIMGTSSEEAAVREKVEKLTRESIVRLPWVCALITKQMALLEKCRLKRNEIRDPETFAIALFCGLIVKKGFELVLLRSADSAISDVLYDLSKDREFGEYEAYLAFRSLLDDKRRDEIEQIRTELFRRISSGSPEKKEAYDRAGLTVRQYSAPLPEAQSRFDRANIDKRKGLQDVLDFYHSVVSVTETYKDKYLT